jgi:hypothetical protein
MVVDGNDPRGIDVGILSRYPIVEIRSHVDDPGSDGKRLFSRDCPEYDIMLPTGDRLVLIPNHLKSKRNGDDNATQQRRKAQADRAHAIGLSALFRSPFVLLGGDFNDSPTSPALPSLFTDGFQDVQSHPNYPEDRPGTYETGLPNHNIVYLIMSPQLQAKLCDTGIERRGSFHPKTWKPFDGDQDIGRSVGPSSRLGGFGFRGVLNPFRAEVYLTRAPWISSSRPNDPNFFQEAWRGRKR